MIKLTEMYEEGEVLFMLNIFFIKLSYYIIHNNYFPPFSFIINNCTDNRKSVF